MINPIILLSGGTGVGTSTFSLELAKILNIPNIISTDSIREIIRSIISQGVNSTLEKSTYLSGQTINYSTKSSVVKKAEIIRAYKIQSDSIAVGINGVISRAIIENMPLIVEGIHLIPGKFRETDLYKSGKNRLIEVLICIKDEAIHKNRFIKRQEQAPERKMEKYLDNFQEIRWIHDYLIKKASVIGNVMLLNNSDDIQQGLDNLLRFYYSNLNN